MSYTNPPNPQRPDPNSQNPIPTGNWQNVAGPGSAPPNPPKPPRRAGNRSQDIRKLNRAPAVAVSLSVVGVLGRGTGIAVASAVSANDKSVESSRSLQGGTSRNLVPAPDSGSSDDGDSGSWSTTPKSNSAPNGGFQRGPSNGGSHGNSGAS